MKIDHLEALLWARIDGTIEPEELAELETYLAEQPGPPEIERQIAAIANELGEMDRVQPPAELRGRIDEALARARLPVIRATPPSPTKATSAWQARWVPVAASLLIGFAVGYLVHPGSGGSIDRTDIAGSMIPTAERMESAPIEIFLDGGSVIANRSGTHVVVDLKLTEEIELEVTLAGAKGPVHMVNLNSTTTSSTDIETEQGLLALRVLGPGTVVLTLSTSTPENPLRVQVAVGGLVTEERWIGPSEMAAER